MIIQGSMRYSPSGRKRKTNAYKKKARPKFEAKQKKNFKKLDTTQKYLVCYIVVKLSVKTILFPKKKD